MSKIFKVRTEGALCSPYIFIAKEEVRHGLDAPAITNIFNLPDAAGRCLHPVADAYRRVYGQLWKLSARL